MSAALIAPGAAATIVGMAIARTATPDLLRLTTRVARMYYERGLGQARIAEQLGLSQARVSRLLKQAGELGIVKITVHVPEGVHADLEAKLEEHYGLDEVILVEVDDAAVRDDEGPVAEELRRALSESRINGEFEDALARAGERIRSQEMIWLVMAIRLQREVGGSLADVMQTTADTMRERAFLIRHVRSLSAEGRFSAIILAALPIAVGLLLYLMRPEYVGALFQQPLGIAMVVAAVFFMIIGTLWLRATVRIEV